MNVIKFSWVISCVNLMVETELVFETLAFDCTLTWLIARENFITENYNWFLLLFGLLLYNPLM
jgi:hypothetical protein